MKKTILLILISFTSIGLAEKNNDIIDFEQLAKEAGVSTKTVAGQVAGKIIKVMAGRDNFYGTRFYIDKTSDTTDGGCNSNSFVYTEPNPITSSAPVDLSGYQSKVSVFLSAYIANKDVSFTVEAGRNGYCKIIEGHME
jgi:hypothetical protein